MIIVNSSTLHQSTRQGRITCGLNHMAHAGVVALHKPAYTDESLTKWFRKEFNEVAGINDVKVKTNVAPKNGTATYDMGIHAIYVYTGHELLYISFDYIGMTFRNSNYEHLYIYKWQKLQVEAFGYSIGNQLWLDTDKQYYGILHKLHLSADTKTLDLWKQTGLKIK